MKTFKDGMIGFLQEWVGDHCSSHEKHKPLALRLFCLIGDQRRGGGTECGWSNCWVLLRVGVEEDEVCRD